MSEEWPASQLTAKSLGCGVERPRPPPANAVKIPKCVLQPWCIWSLSTRFALSHKIVMAAEPGVFRALRGQRSSLRGECPANLHGHVHANLSIHHPSSYPSLGPGPGPSDRHRVTPAHSDVSIPPAQRQPPTPLRGGVSTARPAAPSADVSPAGHPVHVSGLRHHSPQRQRRQPRPQRGGRRDTHQRPVRTQPHQHGVQTR